MFQRITICTIALTAAFVALTGCAGSGGGMAKEEVYIGPYDKPGFTTSLEDGRLWVFAIGSQELEDFKQAGELAKHVTKIGIGPGGMTVKAPDVEVMEQYLAGKRGFITKVVGEDLWVFKAGDPVLARYEAEGELANVFMLEGKGPLGMDLKAPDRPTAIEYLTAKPGFTTMVDEEGRLWVFRAGSAELTEFKASGELAKHVIRPGAGPMGMTIKSPDTETLLAYSASAKGFVSIVTQRDGVARIWVFRPGTEALATFKATGDYEKRVTRPGAGPLGMTVMAPDASTMNAYLRSVQM